MRLSQLAAALTLLAVAPLASAQDLLPAELQARGAVAKEWLKLGDYAAKRQVKDEAEGCLAAAKQVAGDDKRLAKDLAKLQKKLDGLDGEADEKQLERVAKKKEKAAAKVAKIYEKLADLAGKQKDKAVRARLYDYRLEALKVDPTAKRWAGFAGWIGELAGQDAEAAGRLAGRAQELDPPEQALAALEDAIDQGAIGKVVLKKAKGHDMRYYLSLPRGWTRNSGKTWPVLVGVEGAGSNFRGQTSGWVKSRGDLPCIIVGPCTFANTNAIEGNMLEKYKVWYSEETIAEAQRDRFGWDEAGLLAVLSDLEERYGAQKQICVSGFSGGGNLTYLMVFKHPDRVLAAAPTCANFSQPGYAALKGKFDAEALNFRIHIFTGEKDPHKDFTHGNKNSPGIEPQTDWAVKALEEIGYPHFERTMVPGLGHSVPRKQVYDFFRPYMLGEKARGEG